jgi:hypothetical protein
VRPDGTLADALTDIPQIPPESEVILLSYLLSLTAAGDVFKSRDVAVGRTSWRYPLACHFRQGSGPLLDRQAFHRLDAGSFGPRHLYRVAVVGHVAPAHRSSHRIRTLKVA